MSMPQDVKFQLDVEVFERPGRRCDIESITRLVAISVAAPVKFLHF